MPKQKPPIVLRYGRDDYSMIGQLDSFYLELVYRSIPHIPLLYEFQEALAIIEKHAGVSTDRISVEQVEHPIERLKGLPVLKVFIHRGT